MDSSQIMIDDFEQLLQKQSAKKPSVLYNKVLNTNEQAYKPQDVIETVYSQMKAIHLADCTKITNSSKKDINTVKKFSFLPVNRLPVYHEVPKLSPNKFETQCVSDTQLINIIDDAEAIDTNTGITQEFDTTFAQIEDKNSDNSKHNEENEHSPTFLTENVGNHKEQSVLEENTKNAVKSNQIREETIDIDIENKMESILTEFNIRENLLKSTEAEINKSNPTEIPFTPEINSQLSKTATEDTITFIQNVESTEEGENTSEEEDTGQDTQRSPSPVLNMKVTKKKLQTSPLIVSLETFENFENIAFPLIEENTNLETAKHLINSQILGKEISLNINTDAMISIDRNDSPILEYKSDELQINLQDLNTPPIKQRLDNIVTLNDIINDTEKHSGNLKDEILFSSDEEVDYVHKELHELPLTCALATPFCDHPSILEKTMYVGFQTASNKSIQICTDSFEKAQIILEDCDGSVKDFSLTELVKKCDTLNSKHENSVNSTALTVKANDATQTNAVESKTVEDVEMLRNYTQKKGSKEQCKKMLDDTDPPEKHSFVGFMTASSKQIKMSDRALQKCQTVFKNIDLNEKFDAIEDTIKSESVVGKTEEVEGMAIDDKINDELLLQEFENTEMSLEGIETNDKVNKDIEFEGFKTANNENISISKETMANTKNIFDNIDEEMTKQENQIDAVMKSAAKPVSSLILNQSIGSVNVMGFKTASNKNINISTQAIAKSKNIFQDIEIENKVDTIREINQPSTSKAVFLGFKTANNKIIHISDEALSKSIVIFKDLDKRKSKIETIADVNQPSTNKAIFSEFKTAHHKVITIPDDALFKSKNIFNDINERIDKQPSIEEKEPAFRGFKTATNKNVAIAEEAFQNIATNKPVISTVHDKNTRIGFGGFKTANNKRVNISKEALIKSKKMLADLDAKNLESKTLPCITENKDENHVFHGFQTASKKPVNVSADALAKSKRLFQDIDELNKNIPEYISKTASNRVPLKSFETDAIKSVEVCKKAVSGSKGLFQDLKDNSTAFVGFKTASNKNVRISDEAIAKCKKIFDDVEDIPITIQSPSKYTNNQPEQIIFKGFQTANSKEVEISKEALEKTKNLFDDIDSSTQKENIASFGGFQTANNKKVDVSEQALAKSRQLLHDVDSDIEIDTKNKDKIHVYVKVTEKVEAKINSKDIFGFKTGNNKQIQVSEDALKKSKILLAEETLSDKNKDTLQTETKTIYDNITEPNDNVINIDVILNTQVLNNFEENLCTEDFKNSPKRNKRSSSPILSCPRAKKRKKFETPYKSSPKPVIDLNKVDVVTKPVNAIQFREDYKKNKKYTLQDLAKRENNQNKYVDPYIVNFNLENMLDFEFDGERNDLKEGKMTTDGIKRLFAEATDKKLIPEGWMDIQLKLIIWKLISYEVKFPNTLGKVCTVRNVIDQLKYRYDKELYNAERPVLRKILEKDDVSTKTMILCVAGILVDGVSVISVANQTNIELLLTDGWYFVKATIDKMLTDLVYGGKIGVGSKIMTSGAELLNCEQGIAPWEDTSTIRLSISGNSSCLAAWAARLGRRRAAAAARLAAARAGGGRLWRLRARLAACYPALYLERMEDGSTVTRSERLEHLYQMKYEAEREAMIEKIYEEVEKEFTEQESQDSEGTLDPSGKRKCYESGSQIAKMMKTSKDPMEFRAQLTSTQAQLLQEHTSKQRDKYLQAIQDKVQEKLRPRNVVTLVRARIVDVERKGDKVTVTSAMLSVWKPNDAVLEILKEGSWIEIMNVVPTAVRNSEIQLSAGRQSMFRPIKCKEDEMLQPYLEPYKRTCYKIKDIAQNPAMTTAYNEIDTVGIVFAIDPPYREFESIKNQFQNLYLADPDKNMICVNFWGGIKKFGYENVLDTGQVIYCGNLQKRAGNTRKNIPQYRATEFTLFTKNPKNDIARKLVDELNKKLFVLDKRKFCEDCEAVKQNYSVIKCFNDSENASPYRFNKSDYNLGRNKMFIETPIGVKGNKGKSDDFNLTGLDFESTFNQQDTQELSPKTLLRKKKLNEKIAKLKMYGEPPPLCPISIINKSKNAAKSYKSPLLIKDSVATTNKTSSIASVNSQIVATPLKLPTSGTDSVGNGPNLASSPIISMNRTYVKWSSVNPVKLNFSESAAIDENADKTVDHFAEEFDGSPPLSLD